MPDHHDAAEGGVDGHPSESVLAAYLDGELASDERSQVESHLDQCAECRRAVAEVADVLQASQSVLRATAHSRYRRRGLRRPALFGVGLALAASIAAVVVARRPPSASPDIELRTRDVPPTTSDERTAQLSVVVPVDGATGVSERPAFTWRSASGAARYSFRLLSDDGVAIWSHETVDTTVVLPPDVRLGPGRSYFWRVDAMAAGIVANTRAQHFTVAP